MEIGRGPLEEDMEEDMFGILLKMARKSTWNYEVGSLTSISRWIVNIKDMQVTGNRRWEKKMVGHLGSQISGQ